MHQQTLLDLLHALASTAQDKRAVLLMLEAQLHWRLLLLPYVCDLAVGLVDYVAADVMGAQRLLASVLASDRPGQAGLRTTLLDPQTTLWLVRLVRRLAGKRPEHARLAGGTPLWEELEFMWQVAAAVAIRTGVNFRAPVLVSRGEVFLPGLGRAFFGGDTCGRAEVHAHDGTVTITSDQTAVTLPEKWEDDAPGWHGLRRVRVAHRGVALAVALDDLGPRPVVPGVGTEGRLTAGQVEDWRRWLDRMWRQLVEDHPATAHALSAGLCHVVPLPRGERLRPRSASQSSTFGCVLLSAPDDDENVLPAQLGATVVHEFRHTLLHGLDLPARLFTSRGEHSDARYYAPWRDDPRPWAGLLHGAYAFSGVTQFWCERGVEGLAGFEFAWGRNVVREVLDTLSGDVDCDDPKLTQPGHDVVRALVEQSASWWETRVGRREERLAGLATSHHRAAWCAHHRRVPEAYLHRLTEAWKAGRPPVADVLRLPEPEPDSKACRLDVLTVLSRLMLIDPAGFDTLRNERDPAQSMPGVRHADLALLAGEADEAVRLYSQELARPDALPMAWAGLGLALSECGETRAGQALTDRPELAVALSRALSGDVGPVELARWLGTVG
ncbi:aKG-HExxH-type peptide beta-hydroxylase [Streptomyces pseudovenezuelae]|uniref:aKG-HExxH-type peptide beta-hydroxylase n=1 Tax=Streptomyces pseudovenezuelae TaxID=67350 RepID=UPI0036E562C7